MLSKILITLLAASTALASPDLYGKGYYENDFYGKGVYHDGYYKSPKVFEKDVLVEKKIFPEERVEIYGPLIDVLKTEAEFKSMKYPAVVYPKVAQKEEFYEEHLDVTYLEKYPPKPQGTILFPSEYAKYETKSEGPFVPLFKTRKVYADVFEKQFVCPKFEKTIYIRIPGKCACDPVSIHPKLLRATEYPLHLDGSFGDHHGDDDVTVWETMGPAFSRRVARNDAHLPRGDITISRPVDDLTSWLCDSNNATHIRLVHSSGHDEGMKELFDLNNMNDRMRSGLLVTLIFIDFHPEFTYTIFGDDQRIFGFKDLIIKLHFAAGSLYTYLDISFTKQIKTSPTQPAYADDVIGTLRSHMPPGMTNNLDAFMKRVQEDEATFKPHGRKMHEYTPKKGDSDSVFEIYHATFADRGFKEYHERMRLFAIFYIEGAVNLKEDEKWECFVTYEKRNDGSRDSYTLVGYSTCYPFYCYPDGVRMSISQFLILPPYQGHGHGGSLYDFLYQEFSSRNSPIDFGSMTSWSQMPVREISVEDPNESFQLMRDRRDVRLARKVNMFEGLNPPASFASINEAVRRYKLSKLQGNRTYDLFMFSSLPTSTKQDSPLTKAYRLHVKKRLYLKNIDKMLGATPADVKKRLQLSYDGLATEYRLQLDPNTWKTPVEEEI
ncbi:hypothetical protein SmJEL517_g03574 [Synchytrium microbalum]|uniref:Histone acetyltransferase type B catalytic subunit n=1 Tax=Synchytrium microbalum TaxID=1806994 RepID=A0A507C7X1_9FUNG|nr:uncharacterized protein SmJEL517_g03574 [Synchytrium microbalum]TPX33623.1 hypothetical protein SmJEL517_g03574 [Synchytrium microbalum]